MDIPPPGEWQALSNTTYLRTLNLWTVVWE